MRIIPSTENADDIQKSLGEYYATVIDSVGDGVIVVGRDGVITLCNPAAEEITGFSRRQSLGAVFERLYSQETTLVEMVVKTISTGITISDHENVVVRSTGKIKPVAVTCYPLILDNGENIGAILTLKDITYIRELEAAVRQADWSVAPAPADLNDRRVEITGPAEAKMTINALNSGAKVFMADFEDASSPVWANMVEGQINLKDRWANKIR